ncbi:MAG: hypothetical protein ACXWNU_11615 [Candidatus Binataceae bacterium]
MLKEDDRAGREFEENSSQAHPAVSLPADGLARNDEGRVVWRRTRAVFEVSPGPDDDNEQRYDDDEIDLSMIVTGRIEFPAHYLGPPERTQLDLGCANLPVKAAR